MTRSSTSPNLATPIAGADPGTYQGTLDQGGVDYTGRLSGVVASNFLFELQAARHNEKTNQTPIDTVDRRFQTVTPSGVAGQGGFGFYRQPDVPRNFYRGTRELLRQLRRARTSSRAAATTRRTRPTASASTRAPRETRRRCSSATSRPCPGSTTPGCKVYQHEYNSSGQRNAAGDPIEVDIAPGGTISNTNNTGVFIQDKWQVLPTLTLNVGLRWEDQKVKDINGITQIHINDEWMPRVGFAWDFIGDGRSRLYGSYSKLLRDDADRHQHPRVRPRDHDGRLQLRPQQRSRRPACLPAPFTRSARSTRSRSAMLRMVSSRIMTGGSFGEPTQPGIKGQYSEQLHRAASSTSPGRTSRWASSTTTATWAASSRTAASVNADGDLEYFIFNPGSTFISPAHRATRRPGLRRRAAAPVLQSLTLTAQKRFNNNLQFLASYVYSKLEGNYDGVFQTSTGQLDPNINSAYDYRYFLNNAYG